MTDHHHTIECDGKGGPCREIGALCHAQGGGTARLVQPTERSRRRASGLGSQHEPGDLLMAGRYVTPTERPQWPTEQVREFIRKAFLWWLLPSCGVACILLALLAGYVLAGGQG